MNLCYNIHVNPINTMAYNITKEQAITIINNRSIEARDEDGVLASVTDDDMLMLFSPLGMPLSFDLNKCDSIIADDEEGTIRLNSHDEEKPFTVIITLREKVHNILAFY